MRSSRHLVAVALVVCAALSIQRAAAQQWTTSGNNIYNNNSGFVGIGSSSTPATTLHVFGEFTVSGASGDVRWVPRGGSGTTMMMYNPSGTDLRIFGSSDLFTFTSTGNLGIGLGSAAPTAKLHVVGSPASHTSFVTWDGADFGQMSSFSQSIANYGSHVFSTLNAGANKDTSIIGLTEDSTSSTNSHIGVWGAAVTTSNSTQSMFVGVEGEAYRAAGFTGTVGKLAGVSGYVEVGQGTATLTAAFYANPPYSSAPQWATIGTNAGLYIEDQSSWGANVTNNYQIYSASTAPFVVKPNGKVGVGTTTPQYPLDVVGAIHATGAITSDAGINAVYQDLAEWVPSNESLDAGTVVVLNREKRNEVVASSSAYDTSVAGVVSEHPGIVLGKAGPDKAQIATTGRVKVRVDASRAAIAIGDLLVTSEIAGTAMKSEPMEINGRHFHQPGTIIGKALEPLASGQGEILVLLSLQ